MRGRGWLGVLLLAAWPQVAQAQATADDSLDETQKLGRRLFGNHCVVCHEKPQITSIQYDQAQIVAIAAYLKTVPAPPPSAPNAPR